jgi:ribosomal protein L21E
MNLISFEEVVAEAVAVLGYTEDEEVAKNFARQFIWRGMQRLAQPENSIEVAKVYAKNLLIKKPKNLKQFVEIALFDANDNFIPHQFHSGNTRIYPNTEQYSYNVVLNEGESDEETVTYYIPVDLSENTTSFVLGTNGTDVSYGLVRYYPLPLDENNLPEIHEHQVEALTNFVRYQWSRRKNENQSEIQANKVAWMESSDWAIAKTKSMDFSNEVRKKIAANLNRMLPNFNRSRA